MIIKTISRDSTYNSLIKEKEDSIWGKKNLKSGISYSRNTFLFVNMAFGETQKRKVKVSKNKKKSWNKHCDVKEVEEFLEEKRFEERIGYEYLCGL